VQVVQSARGRRTPSERTRPGRRLVVGSVLGAGVGGAQFGLVIGVVAPPKPTTPKVVAAPPQTSPTGASSAASPAGTSSADPTPDRYAAPTPSAGLVTVGPTEAPPQDDVVDPATDPSLRFVRLDDIWRDGQSRVVLRVTPLQRPEGGRTRRSGDPQLEVTIREDARIVGEFFLGDHTTRRRGRFGVDETFRLLRQALDNGQKPTLWIKQSRGESGLVISIREEFLG
jgi:hypothetical protein